MLVAMNRSTARSPSSTIGPREGALPGRLRRALKVEDGEKVKLGDQSGEWDPYTFSILTEIGGTVQFKDLQEGITLNEEVDEVTGLSRLVVADSPDEKRQPAIMDQGAKGNKRYLMPSRAHLMVQDGDEVWTGDILAKIPRESTRTKDITGGLPRVVELFEARKPRETAIISEIDGVVRFGEVSKGQRKIYVTATTARRRNTAFPRRSRQRAGRRARAAGDPLMDGPLNPHDILAVLGEKRTAGLPGQRNPGSLPSAGRDHLGQAHRSHRSSDAALGQDRRGGRHQLPARAAESTASASTKRTSACS
jgi:DNA-directed RNA polymerase subunit beta'